VSKDFSDTVAVLEDDAALVFGIVVLALLAVGGFMLLLLLLLLLLMLLLWVFCILMGHIWWHRMVFASLWIKDKDETLWNSTVIWKDLLLLNSRLRASRTSWRGMSLPLAYRSSSCAWSVSFRLLLVGDIDVLLSIWPGYDLCIPMWPLGRLALRLVLVPSFDVAPTIRSDDDSWE
jgi:hypothetical protein